MMSRKILVALVHDTPGVLEEIVSVYRRRGFNLESVTAGHSEKDGFSRVTLVVEAQRGHEQQMEQARKQLNKLIPVIEVSDITGQKAFTQESVLITIKIGRRREELKSLLSTFRSVRFILQETPKIVSLGIMGDSAKITKAVKNLKMAKFDVQKVIFSGLLALKN